MEEILLKEIPKEKVIFVQLGEKPMAVFRLKEGFVACQDFCPHLGGPLSEGTFDGETVTCPWHGAKFDLHTGECVSGPARRGVQLFKVNYSNAY